MKVLDYLRAAWHAWCELWQFRWEGMKSIDHHKWDSKGEIRRRLAGPHHGS